MSFKITLANRSIKILGAMVKGFSYLFHSLFPNKRFIIPNYAKPLRPSKVATKIPKIIWQTNFTNKATLPVYANYLFNRWISPDYEHRFVDTEHRHTFLKNNAPKEVFEAYEQLTNGAAQADLWRVFVLNFHGGIYMDIDAHAVWPLSKMIQPEDRELFLLNKEHYTNYFIASSKNNPILEKAIKIIVNNIQKKKIDKGVYYLTGPITLNDAIGDEEVNHRFYRYTCVQGSFTNEYFQYLDKPKGKWTHAKNETLLKEKSEQKEGEA